MLTQSKALALVLVSMFMIPGFASFLTNYAFISPSVFPDEAPNEAIRDHTMPTSNLEFIASSDGRKLILFESVEKLRNAMISLVDVEYVFDSIPAVIVSGSVDSNLEGIRNIYPSRTVKGSQLIIGNKSLNEQVGFTTNTLEHTATWVGVDDLWAKGLYGQGQHIAIIDSGIDNTLLAFKNLTNLNQDRGEYFVMGSLKEKEPPTDLSGHGTHVGGIAVGNGYYTIDKPELYKSHGMAPYATFESIKVLNAQQSGDNLDVLMGIDFALSRNVSVISMSFGTDVFNGTGDLFLEITNKAAEKDILMVAAAGNFGGWGGSTIGSPSLFPTTVSVGAAATPTDPWVDSSRGPGLNGINRPDVLAPGVAIVSVQNGTGKPIAISGTSMAVPHVSGGALLLRQAFPEATAIQIKNAIIASAVDMYWDVEVQGRGMVNFTRAYEILSHRMENPEDLTWSASTNPITIHDGTEAYEDGSPVRKQANSYYRASVINERKQFNISIHSDADMVVSPRFDLYFGNVSVELPENFTLKKGHNVMPLNISVISTQGGFNKGTIYFVDANSTNLMRFMNITYFSKTAFPNGKVLIDRSHDADTPSGYYTNDGVAGKLSELSVVLQNFGYELHENFAPITLDLLSNYHLFVLSDPEIPLTESEIVAIRQFMNNGGSVLIMASGGTSFNEMQPSRYFAIDSFNSLMKYNLNGETIDIEIQKPLTDHYWLNNQTTEAVEAKTVSDQTIFPSNLKFPTFGPPLGLTSDKPVVLATSLGQPAVAAQEVGNGRIIVFSSMEQFTFLQLKFASIGGTENIRELALATMKWLIHPQLIQINYEIGGKLLQSGDKVSLELRKGYIINVARPSYPNGTEIDFGETLQGYITFLSNPIQVFPIAFQWNGAKYQFDITFTVYGEFMLEIPVFSGKFSTNGMLRIETFLEGFEDQELHDTLSGILLFLIASSWLIWLKNEKPRNNSNDKKE